MFRRITAVAAVAVAVGAGLLVPAAATAATAAPCPTNRVCVYGGENGERIAARTLSGWAGKSAGVYTTKIVNNTQRPITVTLSGFGGLESWYLGNANTWTIRVAAGGTAAVDSLDASNIRATR